MTIDAEHEGQQAQEPLSTGSMRLEFVGAREGVRPKGQQRLSMRLNYLKGPRAQWRTNIPTYGGIVYEDLWPGIDLEYAGDHHALKYQFVVNPGADPADIRLAWHGVDRVRIDAAGGLEVGQGRHSMHDAPPIAFQDLADQRQGVDAAFAIEAVAGRREAGEPVVFGFDVGDHDPTQTLVIDPAVPVYAGFFGRSAFDRGLGIAVDGQGRAYICGQTTDPATGDVDAYVARVALDGSAYDYIAVIGGAGTDTAFDVVADEGGHAYFTGSTDSLPSSLPVTAGPDLSFNGSSDVLVAKLSPTGDDLVFAGYLGGEMTDFGEGIMIDDAGAIYLHGGTMSSQATFPVKVGPDLSFNGELDAFVAKLVPMPDAPTITQNLEYLGYIGGDGADIWAFQWGFSAYYSTGHIDIDAEGALYVSGETTSGEASFPDGDGFGDLPGPDQTWAGDWDAYVVKVAPDGSGFDYASYVGGTGSDVGKGMAVDDQGRAYFAGYIEATEETLPVVGGPDLSYNGGERDVFVARMAPDGASFEYLGYVGGAGVDLAEAVAVDAEGRLYVVGYTTSTEDSFPVANGPDSSFNDVGAPIGDAFVLRIAADPTAPEPADNIDFASYIGGDGYDRAFWVVLDDIGGVYVVGDATSGADSFPFGEGIGGLAGPKGEQAGDTDGFVLKLRVEGDDPVVVASPTPSTRPTAAPNATPAGEMARLIWLPLALADANPSAQPSAADGEAHVEAGGRTKPAQPAAEALGVAHQEGLVERHFDDFCDWRAGWPHVRNPRISAGPRLDELGLGTFEASVLQRTIQGHTPGMFVNDDIFEVQMTLTISGTKGMAGFLFGIEPPALGGFGFAVTDDGEYVLRSIGPGATVLDRGPAAFDVNAPVTLTVSGGEGVLRMFVNGEPVGAQEAPGPFGGEVGFFLERFGEDEDFGASYDSLRILGPPSTPTP